MTEKVVKYRIQIYKHFKSSLHLWCVRSIERETIDVHFAELPAFALSRTNERRYINQHVIGYQSVSGFEKI